MEHTQVPVENRGILNFGRVDKPFRSVQVDALTWFQENWESADVIVIEAPTATGKSIMVMTIAEYLASLGKRCSIITPTRILQDQYTGEWPDYPVLKGMANYTCDQLGHEGISCRDTKKLSGQCCSMGKGMPPICNYLQARARASAAEGALFNFHSYYANDMYKNVLIADEGHNTINFLYEFYALKLWKCEVGYEDDVELTGVGIKKVLLQAIAELQLYLIDLEHSGAHEQAEKVEEEIERYGYIRDSIERFQDQLLIVRDKGEYFGKRKEFRKTEQEYIYVKPTHVDQIGQDFLWPKIVEKVILLSATISPQDIKTLGLDRDKKVAYYKCPSPIGIDRRPFIYCGVASMKWTNRSASFPKIVQAIQKLAAHHANEKGIVHCTYDMAKKLQTALGGDPRYWFHDKMNKNSQYLKFRAAKGNPILIASGMEEGIDLAFDAGRFQIITQLMRPNLEDKVNAWMVKNNIEQYNWETVRKIIQQTGRICRDPADFGVTYMLDSEFWPFYQRSAYLWPQWFTDSMKRINLGI